MKRITDSLSKEIVAVCQGEIAGIVTNAYTDKKLSRIRGYKVSSEDRDGGRMLPLRRLLGDGDALIVRDASLLIDSAYGECPLGAKVFDTAGAFHGVLRDLVFDETDGKILTLIAEEKEIASEQVLSFGKQAVVLRAPCHDGVLFRRKAIVRKAINAENRSIEKAEKIEETLPLLVEENAPSLEERDSQEAQEPPIVEKENFLFRDYAFLLGRRVTKRIGNEADIVARVDDVVTPDVILRAREKGKLVELTVNSRK